MGWGKGVVYDLFQEERVKHGKYDDSMAPSRPLNRPFDI